MDPTHHGADLARSVSSTDGWRWWSTLRTAAFRPQHLSPRRGPLGRLRCVGSVASFLARHDWQRGQPVLLPAAIADDSREAADRKLDGGISERRTLEAWAIDGVAAAAAPPDLASDPVGLLLLEERDADGAENASYWIACQNFYVLTRYNRSRLYAASVRELALAIKFAR